MRFPGSRTWRGASVALLVMAAVFAAYAPAIGYDFVKLDDDMYVSENPVVKDGFSGAALRAAWTTAPETYWAPLLWMSFMLDTDLYGSEPWGFHLTNVLLFSLNAVLVLVLVWRWTGRMGVALAVALLWALHPARVESVAWITARKDVLSGFFFLLGIGAYVEGRRGRLRRGGQWAWLCMVLGGMAKQIVIVMPAALMLLDVWPLGRTDWDRMRRDVWRLAAEKWAFWILAVVLACLPIWFHHERGFLLEISMGRRLAMIPIHYLFYVRKLLWPTGLMPLQPDLPFRWWTWTAGLGILAGVAWGSWRCRVRHPWALMGWLWFVGLLFPLSGVVWAGQERLATRWVYVPQIGLMLAVVLAADSFIRRHGWNLHWGSGVCALVLAAYASQTARIRPHWRSATTFGEWVWAYNREHPTACLLGGDAYMTSGEWSRAEEAYARGTLLQSKPCLARLCRLRTWCGQMEDADRLWRAFEEETGTRLLEFSAGESRKERGLLWSLRGQYLRAADEYDAAIAALAEAVALEPDPAAFVVAEFLRTCHEAGQPEAGAGVAARLKAAKGLDIRAWGDLLPRYMQFWQEGGRGLAFGYFAEYAKRHPEDGAALNNMAWRLATAEPDGLNHAGMDTWPGTALAWAEQALESGGEHLPGVWDTLAAARANAGDYTGAVAAAERALELARRAGDWSLIAAVQARREGFRAGKPWREEDERAKKANMKRRG